MKILVTGSSGFVGRAVVLELARRGHEIIAVSRIPLLFAGPVQVLKLDLSERDDVIRLLNKIGCEGVIHVAARIPNQSNGGGSGNYHANEDMTDNLLAGLSRNSIFFLLCISSVDVYSVSRRVIDETAALGPETAYAISKLATENACIRWARERSCPFGLARLTQIFGPGDRTAKFVPSAIAAIRASRPVKVFGDGEDRRDYLFVEDVARLISLWAERRLETTLNLVTGESHSMNEVLGFLRNIAGDFQVQQYPRVKPKRDLHFDATRLHQTFGEFKFTPFVDALKFTFAG